MKQAQILWLPVCLSTIPQPCGKLNWQQFGGESRKAELGFMTVRYRKREPVECIAATTL